MDQVGIAGGPDYYGHIPVRWPGFGYVFRKIDL